MEGAVARLGWPKDLLHCLPQDRAPCNALLHANWGHELGHIIAARWVQDRFGVVWGTKEPQIRKTLQTAVESRCPPMPEQALFRHVIIDQHVSDLANVAMKAARQGLIELICDAIGAHLFGPAAVAAGLEFSAGLSLDESPLDCSMYPPWRYRLRLMLDACDDDLRQLKERSGGEEGACSGGTFKAFCGWIEQAKELIGHAPPQNVLDYNIGVREAYALIREVWDEVRAEVVSMLPPGSREPYRLSARVTNIECLVQRLELDIPPNEVGVWPDTTTPSLEDIINAAWVFKTQKLANGGDWATPERLPDNVDRLNRLVLKAIEACFVQATFGRQLAEMDAV